MNKYLLHWNGKCRVIEIDAAKTSAEEWGRIEIAFADEVRGRPASKGSVFKYAQAISLYADQVTPNGIPYEWELAGPDGAWYRLLCWQGETPEAITSAKSWIASSFDAVRIEVLKMEVLPS